MGKSLSRQQIDAYAKSGVHFPERAFSDNEIADLRSRFEALEAREGGKLSARTNKKPHLLLPWLNGLIRHPRILDAVEGILGPDILCWSSQFFVKDAHDPGFISWHQDATYWGLSSNQVVTVWLAFTHSNQENGCLRVVPGSHKKQVEHRDTFSEANMLSRGQEIAVDVDESEALDVILKPGEFSIHNVLLFHASNANTSGHRRIGFAIRYMPASTRQVVGNTDSATLVRGMPQDTNFELEAAPEAEFDEQAVRQHEKVISRQAEVLYRGAGKQGKRVA